MDREYHLHLLDLIRFRHLLDTNSPASKCADNELRIGEVNRHKFS